MNSPRLIQASLLNETWYISLLPWEQQYTLVRSVQTEAVFVSGRTPLIHAASSTRYECSWMVEMELEVFLFISSQVFKIRIPMRINSSNTPSITRVSMERYCNKLEFSYLHWVHLSKKIRQKKTFQQITKNDWDEISVQRLNFFLQIGLTKQNFTQHRLFAECSSCFYFFTIK